jgi:ketosteroid isomerase-like protein
MFLFSTPLLFAQDVEAEKAAIGEILDKFDEAIQAQDVTTLASLLNENAMVCGTDPSEFWPKLEIVEMWNQALSEGAPEFKYIDERRIVVAPKGKSAVAVTQYMIPAWSPNIPWRQVYHMVKIKKDWEILLINIAFVPKNEHIQAINDALE